MANSNPHYVKGFEPVDGLGYGILVWTLFILFLPISLPLYLLWRGGGDVCPGCNSKKIVNIAISWGFNGNDHGLEYCKGCNNYLIQPLSEEGYIWIIDRSELDHWASVSAGKLRKSMDGEGLSK